MSEDEIGLSVGCGAFLGAFGGGALIIYYAVTWLQPEWQKTNGINDTGADALAGWMGAMATVMGCAFGAIAGACFCACFVYLL